MISPKLLYGALLGGALGLQPLIGQAAPPSEAAEAPAHVVELHESLRQAPAGAVARAEARVFAAEGWTITREGQLAWDLGRHDRRATVEFQVRGALDQTPKRILFAARNEAAGTDGEEIQRGKFNAHFGGLRYLFLGRDNYMNGYFAVDGATYRNLRVSGIEP